MSLAEILERIRFLENRMDEDIRELGVLRELAKKVSNHLPEQSI